MLLPNLLPMIHASHIPVSRIDISRTELQKNERKKEAVLQSIPDLSKPLIPEL